MEGTDVLEEEGLAFCLVYNLLSCVSYVKAVQQAIGRMNSATWVLDPSECIPSYRSMKELLLSLLFETLAVAEDARVH